MSPDMRRFKEHRAKNPQRGFTLIEVLLALALTALLLTLLSTGMYVVARDWNENTERLDAKLDESLAILQIERALIAAFPHSFNSTETLLREVYFDGEDDRLSWVSTVSPQRLAGLTAWSIEVVPGGGIGVQTAPAFSDDPTARLDNVEPRIILPGYDLEISYLREPNALTREWTDEWLGSEQGALPLAVHILFRATGAEGSDYDLIAPIKAWRHRSIMPNSLGAGLGQ
ncbi:prepilin-type N-terminal cleavage/methylation domain-containing protein [Gammaproteobacteria bacterium]|nr:prepilin-type N-terminal cleavage/methylation domain-containing protein [Gammaproteobacteria bacterium]